MVFYRKYRPQRIEDLDSKEVRDKLYGVLQSSSVSHAFLFTGSKGLGKTSTARIVAKVLNCIDRKSDARSRKSDKKAKYKPEIRHLESDIRTIEPCNKCEQCKSITNGTNLDILEIDGASNRGIDEIRDLREKVKLSPASSRKKVYIIDEVHMLTQEAFNALLKTLEEPPSHVVFILCTTEPHKVPDTIVSRCLHIQFRKAGEEELVRSFERIIKAEKIKSDKESLSLIASLSDGSFRDGVKILEEMVLSAKDKKITKDLVEQRYQISSIEYQIAKLIRCLEEKDTKSALGVVAKLVEDGVDISHFMQELIATLHSGLLLKAGVTRNSEFIIQSSKLQIEELKRLIELLSSARGELKYAVLPQIPLELVIVEWCMQKSVLRSLRQFKNSSNASVPASRYRSPRDTPSQAGSSEEFFHAKAPRTLKGNEIWQGLINKVKSYNHSIAGVLRGCSVKSYDDKSLIIETNYKFHKDKLSEPKTQEILELACQEITKKNIKVEVLLKAR